MPVSNSTISRQKMKAVLPNANSRLPSTSARMMKMMRVVRGLPWAGIDKGEMALMRGLRWRRVRPGLRPENDHAWADRRASGNAHTLDRKSVVSGKSVSVRVGLGGVRSIKKKTNTKKNKTHENKNE